MSITTTQHSLETVSFKRSLRKTFFQAIPNALIFTMLGGVMLWGHHTGWKMPKASEILGMSQNTSDDWCTSHLVPESQCLECQPDLLPKDKEFGFCNEHGVAECVLHHLELSQTNQPPQLPKFDTVQAIALVDRPENNSRDTLCTHRVQFTSIESANKAGITVDVVGESAVTDTITANGELKFNPNYVGVLSSKVAGTVSFVFKTVGDDVKKNEILALIDSSQIGLLKSELMQQLVQRQLRKKTVERLQPIVASGAVPGKNFAEAETALRETEVALISSRQVLENLGFEIPENLDANDPQRLAEQLRFLGVPKNVVDSLPTEIKTANLIPIRAPFDGVLTSMDIVAGNVVEVSKPLFTISDPSKIWLILAVRQEDAKNVRLNLPVIFSPDNGGQKINGKISWINPSLDPQTRTLQVRAELKNPEKQLFNNAYGSVQIILREEPNAIVVPQEAVQATPDAYYVFVRDKRWFEENSYKFFHVRQVRLGAKKGRDVEILAGVLPGEVIAVKGSNVLLAHLLRGNLGAGCCAED
ncbi:MAG: efflux RND transporter periplasmic adaptor subunit [Planctomycetaceae bacterium]|jgi:cobalt-zinc-cadmium efflux system membrane fusion protein|nr:efflux RND transporter periplasmic adaptor subunit [Planctomycetaceae bacterium]